MHMLLVYHLLLMRRKIKTVTDITLATHSTNSLQIIIKFGYGHKNMEKCNIELIRKMGEIRPSELLNFRNWEDQTIRKSRVNQKEFWILGWVGNTLNSRFWRSWRWFLEKVVIFTWTEGFSSGFAKLTIWTNCLSKRSLHPLNCSKTHHHLGIEKEKKWWWPVIIITRVKD